MSRVFKITPKHIKRSIFRIFTILSLLYTSPAYASKSNDIISKVKDTVIGWFGEISSDDESKRHHTLNKTPQTNDIKFKNSAIAKNNMAERRIYLIDVTRSMEGYNGAENIFGIVKSQLSGAISELNDTLTEIVLIPFTDKPLEPFIRNSNQKEEILQYISNLSPKQGDTNILGAWDLGLKYLEDSKINYMFMLTDGVHNSGAPIEDLYQALNNWHITAKDKYEFALYVLLTPKAHEKEICRIVESSQQMWLVPTLNIKTDFIVGKMNLSVNIRNNNKAKLQLTCTNPEIFNEGFKFRISLPQNEFYKIVDATEVIDSNGNITFTIEKLKPQIDLPLSYKTKIQVEYDAEKFPFVFFTPESYNLNIVNLGKRSMTVKKLVK